MTKVRLVLWKDCHQRCAGCCNKDWDIDNLPVVTAEHLANASKVLLTGGEPLLYPIKVHDVVRWLRTEYPGLKIYVYTAKIWPINWPMHLLAAVDGMTITVHNSKSANLRVDELGQFVSLLRKPENRFLLNRSLRLNLFKGVDLGGINVSMFKVKKDIEWIPNCPLPDGEVLVRLGERWKE